MRDRALLIRVNVLALVITAIAIVGMLVAGWGRKLEAIHVAFMVIGLFLYIILHELVHGLFIYLFSGKSASYGFEAMYAYAKSDAYFDRRSYVVIALSPVVIWGAVLLLGTVLLPELYWVLSIIQVFNLSGAAGDYMVCEKIMRMPSDVLVYDSGTAMEFFSKTE